jgi:hypothetical protein
MENVATSGVQKAAVVIKQMNADDRMKEIARVREKAAMTEGMIKFEAYKEIINNMISAGVPIDTISKYTGLPENQVKIFLTENTVDMSIASSLQSDNRAQI